MRPRCAAIVDEANVYGYRRRRAAGHDSLHAFCDCSEAARTLRTFGLAPTNSLHACLDVLERPGLPVAAHFLLNLFDGVIKAGTFLSF
jgi:hypothetical protein